MKPAYLIILLFFSNLLSAQEQVDVTDQKIKVGGFKEEQLYFGFAEGDKIIFNFQEVDNKEMKEIEIIEYPNNSKFSDFKTSKVENKTLTVTKKSVYIFRFKNSTLTGRICKIQIQRIPATATTKNFNSNVSWITQQDTLWKTFTRDVIAGYDTTYLQKTRKELVSSEQQEELIMDKTERVHSTSNGQGNKANVFFTLPSNQFSNNTTKKVKSWVYWVGVGEEANQAWKNNMKAISSLTKSTATYFISPLGALALGAVTDLIVPKLGEDVDYCVTNQLNKELFMRGQQYRLFDQGKGTAGYKKFTNDALTQGTYFICLSNDNTFQGIDVSLKVVAIIETNKYQDVQYTEPVVTPRYEKKLLKEPTLSSSRVPVTGI